MMNRALRLTTQTVLLALLGVAASGNLSMAQLDIDLPVNPLFQNDYPDKIDNTNDTIAQQGCTLTSWTMAINYAIAKQGLHLKKADGTIGDPISYTPADINTLLNNYRTQQPNFRKGPDGKVVRDPSGKYIIDSTDTLNGWSVKIGSDGKPVGSSSDLNMGALFKAIEKDTKAKSFEGKGLKSESYTSPGFGVTPPLPKDGAKPGKDYPAILDQLKKGIPVEVRVANDTHSVLITSYHGPADGSGRYDIKDPFKGPDGKSIKWLDDPAYKNTIFEYGVSVFKAGGVNQPYMVPSDFYIPLDILFDVEVNPEQYGEMVTLPDSVRVVDVPEPSTIAFCLVLAILCLALYRRKRSTLVRGAACAVAILSFAVANKASAFPDPKQVSVSDKPAILWLPGHTITVNILPPATGDKDRDEAYNLSVEKALKQWNDYQVAKYGAKGYKVKAVRDGKDPADVTIGWVDSVPGEAADTSITAVLARADTANKKPIDIYRNTTATIRLTRKTTSGKPRSADAIQFLTEHEFGHAEGLNHVGEKKVMSAGTTFPVSDDAPPPVDLNTDSSAKEAKSSIHDTQLDNNKKIWDRIKKDSKKLSYHYTPTLDYFSDPIRQIGIRVGDAQVAVSDLPLGWEALFEPDTGLDDVTFNGVSTFVQPGGGTGWLTLFADDPLHYATPISGFDFTLETSMNLDDFYGLDLYTLRDDDKMPYYIISAVPEPSIYAFSSVTFLCLLGVGLRHRRMRYRLYLRE